ncbi:MAG: bifunctional diguanylate cyclase/phosphodiesterase [Lachnospiraceae bacterium]|nr:bifunctional diguanylate cyclase/phosphodiesterase [Lachnospiraceae bacterium]
MGEGNQDALFLTDNLGEELSIIKMRDAFLQSAQDSAIWEYDISSRTMTVNFISDTMETNTVVFEHYNSAVKEAQLINEEDVHVFDVFCAELDAGKDFVFSEFRMVSEKYNYSWYRYMGNAVSDEETGKVTKVFGRRYEITAEKTLKDNQGRKTEQDLLTGLNGKDRAFDLIRAELDANAENASIILVDVDRFHELNESYGKMYGDVVMQTVSGMIYTSFMAKDIVGRIAGDQFIIFCKGITPEKTLDLVGKMMERLWEHVTIRDDRHITVSVGISHFPKDGYGFDELYTKADLALTKAKEEGGNRIIETSHEIVKDIFQGTTFRKRNAFLEDARRTGEQSRKLNKKLFDFTFDNLTKEPDLEKAIEKIFEELCLHYGLDRAFLLGADFETHTIDTTIKWCRRYDGNDVETMKTSIVDHWDEFNDIATKKKGNYFILNSGRGDGMDFFRQIVTMTCVPVTGILFPIMDHRKLSCMLCFDAFEDHEFKDNELTTLESIVRLISSYLISRQTHARLETESLLNRSVMDAQKTVYYVIDRNTFEVKHVSKYGRSFFKTIEYGRKCYESLYGRSERCSTCPLNQGFEDKSIEVYDEEKDRWYTYTATHMDEAGYQTDILISITDVTELLHRVKGEDSLTQVTSYDKFMLLATKAVVAAEHEYTVLTLGIDRFAKINDEYGYVTGDEVLKSLGSLLQEDVGEGEFLCRIKGDDFVLLLKRRGQDRIREKLKDYSRLLTRRYRKKFPRIEITVFGGSYAISRDEQYFNRCLDKAMKAKRVAMNDINKTGGYYVYSPEFEQHEKETDEMTDRIRHALSNDGFRIYFQPKVNVIDNSIIGAEALVRMQDKDGTIIQPGSFIPLAEKNGLVVKIDETVYEKTFAYISKWKKEGKKVPLISINVSRLHLVNDELPDYFSGLVAEYGLEPKEVELEITESIFFEDTERMITMIKRLKELGFVISMDDFGSGYSTLNFMKTLPVDVIKIDGGFFMKSEMDRKNRAVISAIMQLSQNLEFETISEGVETEEQVNFIREQGGRFVQGYYFYKPMPAEEFEKLLG